MNLLQRVKGWFTGSNSQAAGSLLASILQSGKAPRRGTRELLEAYRTSPWFHVALHKIAQETALNGFTLHSEPKASERVRSLRQSKAYGPKSEPLAAHPLLDLLNSPNPIMSAGTLMYLVHAYLDVKGEAVIVLERGGGKAPVQMWVVPPHWLVEPPSNSSHGFRFSYLGWQRTVPESDVIWMRHPDLENPYNRGVGIGEAGADELDIDQFATSHLKNWFFNRAMPDVFLYVEGVKSEQEAVRYEEKLRQKHGGKGKGNQIHVANGKVDLKMVGHTFREQMLPELRSQSRDFILQLYSIPPEVMGIIENSNRATIDAAFYLFSRVVVYPRLCFVADQLTHWAQREFNDPRLLVWFESPVGEDAEFRLKVMQSQPTLFTKNEWRELAGMSEIEEFEGQFPDKAMPMLPANPGPALEEGKPEEDDDGSESEESEESEESLPEAEPEQRGALHQGGILGRH